MHASECLGTELELSDQCFYRRSREAHLLPLEAVEQYCTLNTKLWKGAPENRAGDVVAEADVEGREGSQGRDRLQVLVKDEALGDGQALQAAQLREEGDAFAAAAQLPGPAQVQVAQARQLGQAGVADVLEAERLADVQQLQACRAMEQVSSKIE